MSKNDGRQALGPALAAVAVVIGMGLVTVAALLIWTMIRQRWSWVMFGLSTSLFFLGMDLFVAGCTRKKPQAAEILSSLL